MSGTIRARFKNGVLEPLEKLDLPEGTEVAVTIVESPTDADGDAFRRAAGAWKGSIDAAALIRKIYRSRLVATRPRPRL